jgi:hypothetical protein
MAQRTTFTANVTYDVIIPDDVDHAEIIRKNGIANTLVSMMLGKVIEGAQSFGAVIDNVKVEHNGNN